MDTQTLMDSHQTTQQPLLFDYPLYPTQVQLSKKRRQTFFASTDELPKKYKGQEFVFKQGKLFNKLTKEFVVKNSLSAGHLRFMQISGNEIMRMHEQIRIKIVDTIKDFYYPKIIQLFPQVGTRPNRFNPKLQIPILRGLALNNFPLRVKVHLHAPVRHGNWDVDNTWFYTKCFLDALVDLSVIPSDSIRYVTDAGGTEFTPVAREEERKIIFDVVSDLRPEIKNHVLYSLHGVKDPVFLQPARGMTDEQYLTFKAVSSHRCLRLLESRSGKPGSIVVDLDKFEIHVSVGKKNILYGSVKDALGSVFSQCVQLNCYLLVAESTHRRYMTLFSSEILDRGLNLLIYADDNDISRNQVHSQSQNDSNEVPSGEN